MPIEEITGISTQEFWVRYAKMGAVGLVGGTLWIHRAICEAQALITSDRKPSLWAHAFVFTGKRPDGCDWIAESDIVVEPLKMRIVNGAQENRIDKYYGTNKALHCAVLDFGLSDQDADKVVRKSPDMVSQKILYPVSGLVGTLFAYLLGTEKWRNLWNTPNAILLRLCAGGLSCRRDRSGPEGRHDEHGPRPSVADKGTPQHIFLEKSMNWDGSSGIHTSNAEETNIVNREGAKDAKG